MLPDRITPLIMRPRATPVMFATACNPLAINSAGLPADSRSRLASPAALRARRPDPVRWRVMSTASLWLLGRHFLRIAHLSFFLPHDLVL